MGLLAPKIIADAEDKKPEDWVGISKMDHAEDLKPFPVIAPMNFPRETAHSRFGFASKAKPILKNSSVAMPPLIPSIIMIDVSKQV